MKCNMKNTAHRLKGSSTSSCYKQNENNEIVKKVAAYVLESTETAEKVIFLGVVSAYHQLKKIQNNVFRIVSKKIITTK